MQLSLPFLERATRIELATSAWEADVLPLNYARNRTPVSYTHLDVYKRQGVLFGIFVANPISVGKCRFFLANRQNRGNYDQIFSLFKSGIYLNVVKIMFLRDLYTFLWSLLLIIPGVVKSYEYSMIPYILAENPQIDSDRAFAVSRSMTDGEKISIFVLDWSFFGWIILGTMAVSYTHLDVYKRQGCSKETRELIINQGYFNFQNICQFDSYIIRNRMFSIFIHRNS